jgi:chromosome segregation ATPase
MENQSIVDKRIQHLDNQVAQLNKMFGMLEKVTDLNAKLLERRIQDLEQHNKELKTICQGCLASTASVQLELNTFNENVQRVLEVDERMDERFTDANERFKQVNDSIAALNSRFNSIEQEISVSELRIGDNQSAIDREHSLREIDVSTIKRCLAKSEKRVDCVSNVIYQFIGGLYNQEKQMAMIDHHIACLYGRNEEIERTKNDDYLGDNIWPTTRQGDENRERIEALERKIEELESQKLKSSAKVVPCAELDLESDTESEPEEEVVTNWVANLANPVWVEANKVVISCEDDA